MLQLWIEEESDGGAAVQTVSEKQSATVPTAPSRFKRFQDDARACNDTSELDRYLAYKLPETLENDGKFSISFV